MNPESHSSNANLKSIPMRTLFNQIKSRISNIQSSENIEVSKTTMQACMEEYFQLLEDADRKRKENYERYCGQVQKIFTDLLTKASQSASNVNELQDEIGEKWSHMRQMMEDMDCFDQYKKRLFNFRSK